MAARRSLRFQEIGADVQVCAQRQQSTAGVCDAQARLRSRPACGGVIVSESNATGSHLAYLPAIQPSVEERLRDQRRQADADIASAGLRASLAREIALRQQYEKLLQRHSAQAEEFEHRLLNSVQMIASLVSAQSRVAPPEAAAQLMVACNRIVAFGHVHRQLHILDNQKHVEFRSFLVRLCADLSSLLFCGPGSHAIEVRGDSRSIPSTFGIPLGFIVNELVTNAAKYARGKIVVRFEALPVADSYVLSVSDDGPGLPAGFDPAGSRGLGMKIVRGLAGQIDGAIDFGPGDNGRGARCAVTFRVPTAAKAAPVR